MVSSAALLAQFGQVNGVEFSDSTGLVSLRVQTDAAEAELFLQGAHLAKWMPADEQPVLYLSPRSEYTPGKAIRGGIPVLFPWFGNGWDGTRLPMHGFARTSEWTLESVSVDEESVAHVALTLGPNEASRAIAFPDFGLRIGFAIGHELEIKLTVENRSPAPFTFEEGLHAYFQVSDVCQTTLDGLDGAEYTDKRDNFRRKLQEEKLLRYTRDTDRIYNGATGPLTIEDDAGGRWIYVTKKNSATTVTWNPWSTTSPTIADLPANGWEHFVCVEAVNAGDDRMTLSPGETHTMGMRVEHMRNQGVFALPNDHP